MLTGPILPRLYAMNILNNYDDLFGIAVEPWTDVQRNAVLSSIGYFIQLRKAPGQQDCEAAIAANPCLRNFNWRRIKDFIYGKIQTMKRRDRK